MRFVERQVGDIERAERWILLEWVLVGRRRWWLLVSLLAATAMAAAGDILFAETAADLPKAKLHTLLIRKEEEAAPFNGLFGPLHEYRLKPPRP